MDEYHSIILVCVSVVVTVTIATERRCLLYVDSRVRLTSAIDRLLELPSYHFQHMGFSALHMAQFRWQFQSMKQECVVLTSNLSIYLYLPIDLDESVCLRLALVHVF